MDEEEPISKPAKSMLLLPPPSPSGDVKEEFVSDGSGDGEPDSPVKTEMPSMPSTSSEAKINDGKPVVVDDGRTKEGMETEERERMQVLVSNFTEEQLDRYEMYRRATFPKAAIKRIMQNITGSTVGQNVVIAMSGISKVFAGEVVEEALDYMDQIGESGPLKPKHLREAARRFRHRVVFPKTRRSSVLR